MMMLKNVLEYCSKLVRQVAGYITGGIVGAILLLYEHYVGNSISWNSLEWGVALFLVVSSFSIWKQEKEAVNECLAKLALNGSGTYPDWTIRELFYYLAPAGLTDSADELWKRVGAEVRDKFAVGQLRVWGRVIITHQNRRRSALTEISKPYWMNASFLYWFLSEGHEEVNHTYPPQGSGLPEYCDLRVNKAQALSIWPVPPYK
ncbi:MAG TPA: hypothetical protein VIY48_03575 [Candidatus Paceibacterota bacterium]